MNIQDLRDMGGRPWYSYNDFIEYIVIKEACSQNKTSIDVGCFDGRFTWWMSQHSKLVFAFDPSARVLLKNTDRFASYTWVSTENTGNVVFVNCALGEKQEVLTYTEFDEPSWNSLMPENTPRRIKLVKKSDKRVVVLRLDDVVNASDVGLLKVDAEGFDLQVLRGGIELIKRNKPVIVIEVASSFKLDVVNFLRPLGYEFYNAGWTIDSSEFDINVPALNLICIHKDDDRKSNIILQHNILVNLYELIDNYNYDVIRKWMSNSLTL